MTDPERPDADRDALDERYRRASDADPSRPSEQTRAAILAHARALAAKRRGPAEPPFGTMRAANDRYWWRAAVASVAIVGIALMLWMPRYHPSSASSEVAPAATDAAPEARTAESAPLPAPAGAAVDAVSRPAPRRFGPEPPTAAAPQARVSPAPAATSEPGASGAPIAATPPATMQLAPRRQELAGADAAAENGVVGGLATRDSGASAAFNSRAALAAPAPVAPTDSAALAAAVAAGDVARVQALIARPGIVEARDARGCTPLMLAVLAGQVEVLRVLIEAGADINARDSDGISPLKRARDANRADLATMLQVRGAN